MSGIVVVTFRGPVTHTEEEDGILCAPSSSGGLVAGLLGLPTLDQVSTWVCAAMSDADRTVSALQGDKPLRVHVRDRDLSVQMLRLDPEQQRLTSTVAANPILWFVHHGMWDLAYEPVYGEAEHEAFDAYAAVSAAFGEAVVAELEQDPDSVVMIHDYQLYLVAPYVRERYPDAFLHHFVHVPWPSPDTWRTLPRTFSHDLLRGLLANDVVALHTRHYVRNFLHCCEQVLGLPVDRTTDEVLVDGRRVAVRAYPLSPHPDWLRSVAAEPPARAERARIQASRSEQLVVRVDRADPSKNLIRGFLAWEQLLLDHPEHHGRASMLALVQPTRQDVAAYREYLTEARRVADHVNARFGTPDWQPVHFELGEGMARAVAAFQEYDVLFVNPVRDGMNLVAKEGVLLNEHDGVLVLSHRAGAYEELGEWVLGVHPFDVIGQAEALHEALTMPQPERHRRLLASRALLERDDAGHWFASQLTDVDALRAARLSRATAP